MARYEVREHVVASDGDHKWYRIYDAQRDTFVCGGHLDPGKNYCTNSERVAHEVAEELNLANEVRASAYRAMAMDVKGMREYGVLATAETTRREPYSADNPDPE